MKFTRIHSLTWRLLTPVTTILLRKRMARMKTVLLKVCKTSINAICSLIQATTAIDDHSDDTTDDDARGHRAIRPDAGDGADLEDGHRGRLWQDFANRARERAKRAAHNDIDDDSEGYVLKEDDLLWEIRCKVCVTNILLFSLIVVYR